MSDLPIYRDGPCDRCGHNDFNKLIPGTDPPVYLCFNCRHAATGKTGESSTTTTTTTTTGQKQVPTRYHGTWYQHFLRVDSE